MPDLRRALWRIAAAEEASPSDSFPDMVENESEREAVYRFFNNEAVTASKLLAPHVKGTAARCNALAVVHDTTDFSYSGERDGFGYVQGGNSPKRGFFFFTSDSPSPPTKRVVHWGCWRTRHIPEQNRKQPVSTSRQKTEKSHEVKKSQPALGEVAQAASKHLHVAAIDIMDREADDYALFDELQTADLRFVIRVTDKRFLEDGSRIETLVEAAPSHPFRTALLSTRKTTGRRAKIHPPRLQREAHLQVRASGCDAVTSEAQSGEC